MTWVTISCGASSWARLAMTSASSKRCSSLSRLYWSTNSASFCCVCSFTLASRVSSCRTALFFSSNSIRERFCSMKCCVSAIDRSSRRNNWSRRRRLQPGRFDLLSRFLQHGQRRLGVFLQHLPGVGLAMIDVGEDLPEQGLLGGRGLVERRSRLARRSGRSAAGRPAARKAARGGPAAAPP